MKYQKQVWLDAGEDNSKADLEIAPQTSSTRLDDKAPSYAWEGQNDNFSL